MTTEPVSTSTAPPVLSVGVLRESTPGEQRVGLTPDGVTRLTTLGLRVLVEVGAGSAAWFADAAYAGVGALMVDIATLLAESDVVVCVRPPSPAALASMRPGQSLIGLLQPFVDPAGMQRYLAAGISAISFDCLPRTLSSAQSMDVLTSQANVAGYKAALLAASMYGSYFPMLMTAAGTVRPAKVLVLGAGVAGLQAIGTARRLGAVVTAYDLRDAARADVASTGAAFLELDVAATPEISVDGYAQQQSATQQQDQAAAMAQAIGGFDIVISTAQVPGRRPPVLVSKAALSALGPGSVVVDLASGPLGGNVEGSVPEATLVTDNGVTVVGAGNLASTMPRAASTAYSRNVTALLAHLVRDGRLVLDPADAVTAATLIAHDGAVVLPGLLAGRDPAAGVPQLAAIG